VKNERVKRDPVIREFLGRISPLKFRIDRIILFGSRARGDEKPYSDYDVLIVVPEKERSLIDALYDATMEVLFKTHRLISLKVYRKTDFDKFAAIPTPFIDNVLREGVLLG
jgi:predicted nucleotidyltransferase